MNDFEKGFLASFIGYWLGAKLDQTRLGIWFNTNPTVDKIWKAGKAILLSVIALLVMYYVILVIGQFSS